MTSERTPAEHSSRVGREPALIVIVAIGVALRAAWLFQPIRYDEAVTYLEFARAGVRHVVTSYDAPNNHVFHTLLVWLVTRASDAPWAIRLPAFVAGCVVPLAAYVVGRRLHGRSAALLGAALVACSVHLIEYATNARGYSIVTLLTLAQIALADRIVRRPAHADLATFALATAIGFYTVPTMLYPTLATLGWAGLVAIGDRRQTPWRRLARRAPAHALAAIVLTLALYAPILAQPGGPARLTANRWVAPLSTLADWRHAMAGLGAALIDEWSLGLTRGGLAIVATLALVGATVGVVRRRDARATWIIVAAGVVVATLFAQRVAPFARVFGFALPMLLLAGAAGAVEVLRWARLRTSAPAVGVAACVGLAAYVAIARLPDRAAATDKFPDAAAVVAFLSPKADAGDAVICGVVPSATLEYTLARAGRPMFAYRPDAVRLWIVMRGDEPATDVFNSRRYRLRAVDFAPPRLAYERGDARVYLATPRGGRTPASGRRRG